MSEGFMRVRKPGNYFVRYIKKRLLEENKNFLAMVCGSVRSGKSWASLGLAEAIDSKFNIDRVCFSFAEFMKLLTSGTLKKGNCIVGDEWGVKGMPVRNFWSVYNKTASYILQTFGKDNLGVFFTTPVARLVDPHGRIILHCSIETIGINREEGLNYIKAKLVQVNPWTGETYRKYLKVKIDRTIYKITKIIVPKPSPKLLEAYEEKQRGWKDVLKEDAWAAIKQIESKLMEAKTRGNKEVKEELTEKQKEVYLLKKQGLLQKDIAKKLNVSERAISDIVSRIKKKGYSKTTPTVEPSSLFPSNI